MAEPAPETRIEDIYELSPLQEAMLVQCLYAGRSDAQMNQAVLELEGELDEGRLREALGGVLARHPVLRTAFVWEDLDQPYQVVEAEVAPVLVVEDWTTRDADEQARSLERLLEADRAAGFDLRRPPLLRLIAIRTGPRAFSLVWSFHHIILDGLSFTVVLGDFWRLAAGAGSTLPPAPPDYGAFVRWLHGRDAARAERYWVERLAGIDGPTHLPVDRAGPGAITTGVGTRTVSAVLDAELAGGIRDMARACRVTTNTVMQGAWALMLARYCGSDDVVFGVVVSGRPVDVARSQEMVGLFVNALPARVTVDPRRPLREWLQALQSEQLELREHDYCSLAQIQGWAGLPRGLPPFESTVIFENWYYDSASRETGSAGALRSVKFRKGSDQPLTFDVFASAQMMRLDLLHDPERFETPVVERMLEHLKRLLAGFVQAPAAPLGSFEMVGAADRAALERVNATTRALGAVGLHELFERRAERLPDAIALELGAIHLTCRELDVAANRLAHHLAAEGVTSGTVVGVLLERSVEAVIGLLAVLKAGGTFVAFDPADPADRLAWMLADSRAPCVLTRSALAPRLAETAARVVCVDGDAEAIAARPPDAPTVRCEPDDVAYLIYTSGSTGRPKGAMGTHRGMVNRIEWMLERHPFAADERACQKTTLGFVDCITEIFTPLASGAPLAIAPDAVARDADALARFVAAQRITRLVVVPSLLRAFLDLDHATVAGLACVRHWVTSGERLAPELERELVERFPAATVLNLYGSSEVAGDVTAFDASERAGRGGSLIGRPIANTAVHVLGSHMTAQPIGVPGELHVAGFGLARGYLGRDDLTAERFSPSPLAACWPDGRLYRTGDLVRMHDDGVLEYLGRVDQQLKVRGHRVEPAEVELALTAHPAVREAVVSGDGEHLLAHLVLGEDATVDPEALRAHVAARLPAYMVPAAFTVVERVPLTASGKVDRRALAATGKRIGAATAHVEPATDTERRLAEIWKPLLGVERVGRGDGFFALGGHSLGAARVLNRVRHTFGVDLALRDLFDAPTLAGLAARIDAGTGRAESTATPIPVTPRPSAPEDPALAASFGQERLWFLHQLDPAGAAYNLTTTIRLAGAADVDALRIALAGLVARHEVLRTTFAFVDHRLTQVVSPPAPVDLTVIPASDGPQPVVRALRGLAWAPFDLAAGPLLRAAVVVGDDLLLQVTAHHTVSDRWSMGILSREVVALYAAARDGTPAALPELAIQYADFAAWERASLDAETTEREVAYWRHQLADLAPLDLPTDHPRPAVKRPVGARATAVLPASLVGAVRALARGEGTTEFTVLATVVAALLHRLAGQDDIAIGTPVANRSRPELEPLIGFFTNTLVLRVDLSAAPTTRALLGRVSADLVDALAHQRLPFERLVEALNPPRDPGRSPLFQALVVELQAPEIQSLGRSSRGVVHDPRGATDHDLEVYLGITGDGLVVDVRYSTELFEPHTVAGWIAALEVLLGRMTAEPDRRIDSIALLEADAQQAVLGMGRGPELPIPASTVLDLFHAQVARAPDAVAVGAADGETTYARLADRARVLAARLRALGAGPGERVAVCLDRTLDLPATLLAVMASGAAYVPLDPAFPTERIRYMLEHSGARVVVTQGRLGLEWPGHEVLDLDADAPAGGERAPENVALGPGDGAYVIYTSGSTGRPKGVCISHGALANLLWSMHASLGVTHGDVLAAVTTLSFDIAGLELFLPLVAGARLEIVSREEAADGVALASRLERCSATVMQATPATWRLLLDSGWRGRHELVALCGGEAMPAALATALRGCTRAVWNLYGPTETTIWSTAERLDDASVGATVSIGRPIGNTRVYVLDDGQVPVPVGVRGEIWIAGDGVADGYWSQPELTIERFLPDPFAADPGARMYRTGDVGRWRRDGRLEHLGRADQQIKLRGHRIEPAEIEAVLATVTGSPEVSVLCREDRPGDQRLVAYLVGGTSLPDDEALRAHAREHLPVYMVPSSFVRLDAFPRTPNGKLDRARLPAPAASVAPRAQALVEPATPTERLLAEIWAGVLGLPRVSVVENFFDLGGHSLLVVDVIAQMRERTGVQLPPREFMMQSLRQIAAAYDRAREGGERAAAVDESAAEATHEQPSRPAESAAPAQRPVPGPAMVVAAGERIEPLFFGPDDARLYGCLHRPADDAPPPMVAVVCQPAGREYVRCHRSLRQLCTVLARAGIASLRFDYFGAGDSAGESDEARLARWVDDAAQAVRLARSRTGAPRVALVGVRLGAAVALRCALERESVDRLVLWAPTVHGASFMHDMREQRAAFERRVEGRFGPLPPELEADGELDFMGFRFGRAFVDEIEALDLLALAGAPAARALVVDNEGDAAIDALAERLRGGGVDTTLDHIEAPAIWKAEPYQGLVPARSLARILEWLQEG
ncbi:MAG: amino acid adenylation domain-containing protein [Chromatiales bacterium]|nr:amino acid adenylation domain-containing protein [Chromatiales bacterium]